MRNLEDVGKDRHHHGKHGSGHHGHHGKYGEGKSSHHHCCFAPLLFFAFIGAHFWFLRGLKLKLQKVDELRGYVEDYDCSDWCKKWKKNEN